MMPEPQPASRGEPSPAQVREALSVVQGMKVGAWTSIFVMVLGMVSVAVSAWISIAELRELRADVAAKTKQVASLTTEVNRKQAQLEGMRAEVERLGATRTGLQRDLDAWAGKRVLDVVFLQYDDPNLRDVLDSVRVDLKRQWLAASAPQDVGTPQGASYLRYYYLQDSAAARKAIATATRSLQAQGCPKDIRPDFYAANKVSTFVRQGTLELYIADGCNGR